METKDWKSTEIAKVLLIGHDPRLQKSDTIAEYAFFADYFFNPLPRMNSEKRKYSLAKTTFDYIVNLTNEKFKPENIYITNLCNSSLNHSPKGKTVLIPEDKAKFGMGNIKRILKENPTIEYIFPMSLQVNYWLQKLDFYYSDSDFIELTEPLEKGLNNNPPYFQPKSLRTFLLICGKKYKINDGSQTIIPILHSKNFPLKKNFQTYENSINIIKEYFK